MKFETETEMTVAESVKFSLEFMQLMLQCGRDEMAVKGFNKAMKGIQQLIDEGK